MWQQHIRQTGVGRAGGREPTKLSIERCQEQWHENSGERENREDIIEGTAQDLANDAL